MDGAQDGHHIIRNHIGTRHQQFRSREKPSVRDDGETGISARCPVRVQPPVGVEGEEDGGVGALEGQASGAVVVHGDEVVAVVLQGETTGQRIGSGANTGGGRGACTGAGVDGVDDQAIARDSVAQVEDVGADLSKVESATIGAASKRGRWDAAEAVSEGVDTNEREGVGAVGWGLAEVGGWVEELYFSHAASDRDWHLRVEAIEEKVAIVVKMKGGGISGVICIEQHRPIP